MDDKKQSTPKVLLYNTKTKHTHYSNWLKKFTVQTHCTMDYTGRPAKRVRLNDVIGPTSSVQVQDVSTGTLQIGQAPTAYHIPPVIGAAGTVLSVDNGQVSWMPANVGLQLNYDVPVDLGQTGQVLSAGAANAEWTTPTVIGPTSSIQVQDVSTGTLQIGQAPTAYHIPPVIGAAGTVLTVDNGQVSWVPANVGLQLNYDIPVDLGQTGQVLSAGAANAEWTTPTTYPYDLPTGAPPDDGTEYVISGSLAAAGTAVGPNPEPFQVTVVDSTTGISVTASIDIPVGTYTPTEMFQYVSLYMTLRLHTLGFISTSNFFMRVDLLPTSVRFNVFAEQSFQGFLDNGNVQVFYTVAVDSTPLSLALGFPAGVPQNGTAFTSNEPLPTPLVQWTQQRDIVPGRYVESTHSGQEPTTVNSGFSGEITLSQLSTSSTGSFTLRHDELIHGSMFKAQFRGEIETYQPSGTVTLRIRTQDNTILTEHVIPIINATHSTTPAAYAAALAIFAAADAALIAAEAVVTTTQAQQQIAQTNYNTVSAILPAAHADVVAAAAALAAAITATNAALAARGTAIGVRRAALNALGPPRIHPWMFDVQGIWANTATGYKMQCHNRFEYQFGYDVNATSQTLFVSDLVTPTTDVLLRLTVEWEVPSVTCDISLRMAHLSRMF
jgi:hypothetical protein